MNRPDFKDMRVLQGCAIYTVFFILLKVLGVVTWSWWWLLAPFWVPPVVFGVGGIVLILFIMIRTYYRLRKEANGSR